jgi:hypothetical protein
MTRDQLTGTWRCTQTGSTHELRSDGSCTIRTTAPGGQTHAEQAEWEHIDAKHWKLRLIIPPDPQTPGLEDGAVEVVEYEIRSEQPNRMSLMQFDVEFPWEWEKATPPAG